MDELNQKIGEHKERRHYNGMPIIYFREHYSSFNLSRSELADTDSRLYKALIRHGQLEEAIPEIKKGYQKGHAGRRKASEYIVKDIIEAYDRYEGNATAAEKVMPYSDKTIIKIWRQNNLPIKRPSTKGRRRKYF